MKLKTINNLRKLITIIVISAIILLIIGVFIIFVLPYYHPVTIKNKDYIFILSGNEVTPYRYLGNETKVSIPDSYFGKKIVSVGDFCFGGNKTIESVEIPDTVKYVRFSAFEHCSNLVSVKADNIVLVEDGAFFGDEKLKNVELGSHLEVVERTAFGDCKSLEYIPSYGSLKMIGDGAFKWSGITEIGDLTGVNLESEEIFDGTPWMENQNGEYVIIGDVLIKFNGESSISVIPEGVKTIASAYNWNPDRNISVYIPSSTTRIASYALIASEYYTVYIPKNVDSIVDINELESHDEKSCKIITVSGSYAEQYAKEHGMNYEIVDGWEVPEEK